LRSVWKTFTHCMMMFMLVDIIQPAF